MTKGFGSVDDLSTDRLRIQDWKNFLADPAQRKAIESSLAAMLTPMVTHRLPLSMGFPGEYASISDWVDARDDEAQIFSVHEKRSNELAGLVILWRDDQQQAPLTIHLGYFFAEKFWGRGFATEVIKSLVSSLNSGPSFKLLAGVDHDNIGSARVLQKSGFSEIQGRATEGRLFFEYVPD